MSEHNKKTVEEKIDLLIEESERNKVQRKKERVLSKIDALYNVLIALTTFFVGLIISQHDFFISQPTIGLLLTVIGVIFAMITSYAIGFVGMIKDSIEKRILSWSLFLTCLVFLLMVNISSFFNPPLPQFTNTEDAMLYLSSFHYSWSDVTSTIGIFIVMIAAWKFPSLIETKISSAIEKETPDWEKIRPKIILRSMWINVVIYTLAVVIAFIIAFPR